MRKKCSALVSILVAAMGMFWHPASSAAQSLPLDSLFRAHRYPLEFTEAGPTGRGFEFIVGEAARAQFVMIGESHGVREIPLFTAALFKTLHRPAGFNYLALENGPFAVEMFMAPGVRGSREAAVGLSNRYVNALQFRNDQEVHLIADVAGTSTARSQPVWGLDQSYGALHILERVHELAASRKARAMTTRMLRESRELEADRPGKERERYISDRLRPADVEALRQEFKRNAEASRLIEMLATSREIYQGQRSKRAVYGSNDRRENYMRSQFMRRYREAQASGDTLPRALLKFGHWHAMKGVLNWGEVVPFGTFVSELAKSNGMESLFIWTGLVNEPGHFWTLSDYPDYAAIARAGSTDRWWVIDLRPLRPLVAAGEVNGVNDEMKKVIFGFDLAVLIGGGNPGTFDAVQDRR